MVAFCSLPQNFGRWLGPSNILLQYEYKVEWWGYPEVVGTLKSYLLLYNLFEPFALTGGGDAKTLGACPHA